MAEYYIIDGPESRLRVTMMNLICYVIAMRKYEAFQNHNELVGSTMHA